MKAVYYTSYGPPDILQLVEMPKPVPKENEILVKIHAASINSWDWDLIRGKPWIVRMWGLFKPKYKTPGADIAGVVEAVGARVQNFKPGDEVFCDLCECGFGGFAEYKCALETRFAKKPASMSFVQAASIPQAGMMALQGIRDVGEIRQGQEVLINGAGGGVGTFAIQIAKLYGAEMTGVDGETKLEFLRSIGCHHVIDYRKVDFTRTGKQYDLVLDVTSNRSPFAYARALKPNGIYATVGGKTSRLLQILFLKGLIRLLYKKNIRIVALKPNRDLDYFSQLFSEGKLSPIIDGPFPIEQVVEAFKFFSSANFKGKIVITM